MSQAMDKFLKEFGFMSEDVFHRHIIESSLEFKDEFLRRYLRQDSMRFRFVAEERKRHADRLDAEEAQKKHDQALSLNRELFAGLRDRVTTIDGRLATVERVSTRSEVRTWGFWLA